MSSYYLVRLIRMPGIVKPATPLIVASKFPLQTGQAILITAAIIAEQISSNNPSSNSDQKPPTLNYDLSLILQE